MARLLTTGFELEELIEHNGSVIRTLSAASHQIQSTLKRTGNYAWYIDCRSTPTNGFICCTHTINEVSELYARIAIYVSRNDGSSSNVQNFLSLFYFTNNQLFLGLRSDDMRLRVGYGSGELGQTSPTVVATGNVTITYNNWYVVELHVAISGAYYEGSVKVNGVTDFTFAFSRGDGSPYINIIKFGFNGAGTMKGCDIYLDDIAINDTTGDYQNSWPGTGGVYLLKPNGEGTVQQWTPSEGTVHYTLVDEIPKNTTDWVYDQISGHVELFALEDLPSEVTSVQLVEVVYQAALAEAGVNDIRDVIRHNGNNYSGTTEAVATVAPNYKLYKGQTRYIEAGGTLPWTPAQVNALEAGIEIP
jgi:hypothetical protein